MKSNVKKIMNELGYNKRSSWEDYTQFIKHNEKIIYKATIGLDQLNDKVQIEIWAINDENGEQYSQVYWCRIGALKEVVSIMERHVKPFLEGVIG